MSPYPRRTNPPTDAELRQRWEVSTSVRALAQSPTRSLT